MKIQDDKSIKQVRKAGPNKTLPVAQVIILRISSLKCSQKLREHRINHPSA